MKIQSVPSPPLCPSTYPPPSSPHAPQNNMYVWRRRKRLANTNCKNKILQKVQPFFCLSVPLTTHIKRFGAELQKEPISLGTGCVGTQHYATLVQCLPYAVDNFDNMYIVKVSYFFKHIYIFFIYIVLLGQDVRGIWDILKLIQVTGPGWRVGGSSQSCISLTWKQRLSKQSKWNNENLDKNWTWN